MLSCFALLCFALLCFALLLASADADADVEACWLISAPRAAYTYTANSRSDAPGENGSSVLPVLARVAEIAH
jgi:hypothetical protein